MRKYETLAKAFDGCDRVVIRDVLDVGERPLRGPKFWWPVLFFGDVPDDRVDIPVSFVECGLRKVLDHTFDGFLSYRIDGWSGVSVDRAMEAAWAYHVLFVEKRRDCAKAAREGQMRHMLIDAGMWTVIASEQPAFRDAVDARDMISTLSQAIVAASEHATSTDTVRWLRHLDQDMRLLDPVPHLRLVDGGTEGGRVLDPATNHDVFANGLIGLYRYDVWSSTTLLTDEERRAAQNEIEEILLRLEEGVGRLGVLLDDDARRRICRKIALRRDQLGVA